MQNWFVYAYISLTKRKSIKSWNNFNKLCTSYKTINQYEKLKMSDIRLFFFLYMSHNLSWHIIRKKRITIKTQWICSKIQYKIQFIQSKKKKNQKKKSENQISVSTTYNTRTQFNLLLNTQTLPVEMICGLSTHYRQVLPSSPMPNTTTLVV